MGSHFFHSPPPTNYAPPFPPPLPRFPTFPPPPLSHLATTNGFLEGVKLILARDPTSISSRSAVSQTPLHLACMHGHEAIAKFLLEKGCEKKGTDAFGKSALYYAGKSKHRESNPFSILLGAGSAMQEVEALLLK